MFLAVITLSSYKSISSFAPPAPPVVSHAPAWTANCSVSNHIRQSLFVNRLLQNIPPFSSRDALMLHLHFVVISSGGPSNTAGSTFLTVTDES